MKLDRLFVLASLLACAAISATHDSNKPSLTANQSSRSQGAPIPKSLDEALRVVSPSVRRRLETAVKEKGREALEVVVEDSDTKECRSMEQTCRIIDGIRVCNNEYVKDVYNCRNFAIDFRKEATEKGIPTWHFSFGCAYRNFHSLAGYERVFSHAANIIEVAYPDSAVLHRFCVVEPQNNHIVGCYLSESSSPTIPLPPASIQTLRNYYDRLGWAACIQAGWGEYFQISS